MPRKIDFLGARIGHVSITKLIGTDSRGRLVWECECDCGRFFFIRGIALSKHYVNQSCGCKRSGAISKAMTKHGHNGKRTYSSWHSMKTRCLNPNAVGFPNYGGRGIKVCERWLKFENFLTDMGERPNGMTLERKDYNGNYEPSNCAWADDTTQRRNRRNNRFITIAGETKCISEWAAIARISKDTMWYRIKFGWSGLDLLLPVGKQRQKPQQTPMITSVAP